MEYPANKQSMIRFSANPRYSNKLIVKQFTDRRKDEFSIDAWITLIPFVQSGCNNCDGESATRIVQNWTARNPLDAVNVSNQLKLEDFLQRAAIVSLRHSNLFREIEYLPTDPMMGDDLLDENVTLPHNGLMLSYSLLSTRHTYVLNSYGISFFYVIPAILGMPINDAISSLELTFTLRKDGKVVWRHTYKKSSEAINFNILKVG